MWHLCTNVPAYVNTGHANVALWAYSQLTTSMSISLDLNDNECLTHWRNFRKTCGLYEHVIHLKVNDSLLPQWKQLIMISCNTNQDPAQGIPGYERCRTTLQHWILGGLLSTRGNSLAWPDCYFFISGGRKIGSGTFRIPKSFQHPTGYGWMLIRFTWHITQLKAICAIPQYLFPPNL